MRVRRVSATEAFVAGPLLHLAMFALWPARLIGLMGTKSMPRFYDSGDPVPLWILLSYPLGLSITFECRVMCYYSYRNAEMVAQAVEPADCIVKIAAKPKYSRVDGGAQIVGAPTAFVAYDGTRIVARRYDMQLAADAAV